MPPGPPPNRNPGTGPRRPTHQGSVTAITPLTWADGWSDRHRDRNEYMEGCAIPYTPAASSPVTSAS
jgi:hypothetical protein